MNRIQVREQRKCYDLCLLPALSSGNTFNYEIASEVGVKKVYRHLDNLIKGLDLPAHASSFFGYKMKYLEGTGGILASLNVKNVHRKDYMPCDYPELDLGYCVTKEVRIWVGNVDISCQVKKNPLILNDLELFLRELYNYHEKYYLCNREGDVFVNELFLMDDVDVVVGHNSAMNINIDHSLRDYLVSLNERLRISA